jgi:hypothetical protein
MTLLWNLGYWPVSLAQHDTAYMVNKAQPNRATRWNFERRQFIQFEPNYTFNSQRTAFILQMCKRVAHPCIK